MLSIPRLVLINKFLGITRNIIKVGFKTSVASRPSRPFPGNEHTRLVARHIKKNTHLDASATLQANRVNNALAKEGTWLLLKYY